MLAAVQQPLLAISDLAVSFQTGVGRSSTYLRAVDGVSIDVPPRSTVGLVGESGSGKSVTALSILRLLPQPPARIDKGAILLAPPRPQKGEPPLEGAESIDVLKLGDEALRKVRGGRIAMIFQEPMTALNPVYTIGDQLGEALRAHQPISRREGLERATGLLEMVGVPDAARRRDNYPHQMSGGQRQRVMIAMALSCRPDLLIADEPTTALDVTTQAQILDLLGRLQAELGMSMLLISHDLGVISAVCQHVSVMYAGQIVESAPARALFRAPRHHYTAGLMLALPRLGARHARLREIPGRVPRPSEMPTGCRFADRCPQAADRCRSEAPQLRVIDDRHEVRCHFPISPGAAGVSA
jgi:peptide/nickel transport system ATP-binding protein/oligopeptide transport system ATP-binding protein